MGRPIRSALERNLHQAGRHSADLLALLFTLGFEVQTLGGTRVTEPGVAELVARLRTRRYTDLVAGRP